MDTNTVGQDMPSRHLALAGKSVITVIIVNKPTTSAEKVRQRGWGGTPQCEGVQFWQLQSEVSDKAKSDDAV